MIRQFTSKTQKMGERGEDAAAAFLMKHGFRVIERNVANKFGEIDIVAQKDKIVCFFEVKTGKQGSAINPAENLHPRKMRKFLRSVEYYCLVNRIAEYRVQGMVVLEGREGKHEIEIMELF